MNALVEQKPEKKSLVAKFAAKYGVEPEKMLYTLKATAFRQKGDQDISNEQMAALMIVADQYGLNPFTKEIYAYPDKNNGIVPVVGVDGWNRIINEHPQFDGIEFVYSPETITHKGRTAHVWIDCTIHRKDRRIPTVVREYFDEVVRNLNFATPWDTHPKRMHRHKVEIQCARIAFGFAGIDDDDEAERIMERDMGAAEVVSKPSVVMPKAKAKPAAKAETVEHIDQASGEVTTLQQVVEVAAPAEVAAAMSNEPPADMFEEPAKEANNNAATDGEKMFIKNKANALGINMVDMLGDCGLTDFDGLTKDGFTVLKDYLTEMGNK